jgi:hypothetical protein
MPHLRRFVLPVIMPSVLIFDRCSQQFFRRQVVEASQVDCVECAGVFHFALAKRLDPAGRAKEMRDGLAAEPVFSEVVSSSGYSQSICANKSLPESSLRTGGAIALACTLIKVEFCFEADCAAMTIAMKGFFHLFPPDARLLQLITI